jgi:UDP-sugar transporter A1/2/3
MALGVSWQGWVALATFSLQNGIALLLMRWSKVKSGEQFSSQVAVLMQEAAVKLPISAVLYAHECGGFTPAVRSLVADFRERYMEWLQLAVPALLYTVQNTLLYVGLANVEAAIGQITYQSKILWTAMFSIIILGKKLSSTQWLALVVLALGILAVQGVGGGNSSSGASGHHANDDSMPKHSKHYSNHRHHHGRSLADVAAEQNPALGIGAMMLAAICTSFASVYFEKMLKGASKPSLWLRNIQLSSYSSVIAIIGLLLSKDASLAERGWMAGFGPATWASVIFQASGGIIVAITIKYADNILRGFAQALALIVGAIGSWLLFDFHLTPMFSLGVVLVIGAVFLYGSNARSPQELCETLSGTTFAACCGGSATPQSMTSPESTDSNASLMADEGERELGSQTPPSKA